MGRQRDTVRPDIHPGIVEHLGDDRVPLAGGNPNLEALTLHFDQDVQERLLRRDARIVGDLGAGKEAGTGSRCVSKQLSE